MFNMAIGDSPKSEPQEGESTNKLEDMIRELSGMKNPIFRDFIS